MSTAIDKKIWQTHAWRNRLQSLVLLGLMFTYTGLLGGLIFGGYGLAILLVFTVLTLSLNPSVSPSFTMRLYQAERLSPQQAPGLYDRINILAKRAGLVNEPELYYIPSRMLNAFAVGSQTRSAVGITDGLLRTLNLDELTGVLAHEISHIRSNDVGVMSIADLFSRVTSMLSLLGQGLVLINVPLLFYQGTFISWWIVALLVFAPSISALTQLALSRTRELDADLNAAKLTGNPEALASALAKIESLQGGWFERVFLPGKRIPEPSLLRTHPPVSERIDNLLSLKNTALSAKLPQSHSVLIDSSFTKNDLKEPPRWHISGLWF
ncbi:Zn-dependent protease [Vibrio alginolyticus]|uniref:zinc metalloprotease HtpX n=1 Tax=Vibrio TaxID=662 RepID=UPI0003ED8DA1|nr:MULTISPECIES: zinc metalloprotease HtpX [Vibrio]EKF9437426.1 M48 family metalloprotease [Vibrio cholerae]TBT35779.1 peptidase M48 [Vibrio parahaemolyticus]BCB43159.1 Zn-dependent protease [Vibrio alginolyticus]AHI98742.1 Peptidase, M48 family [Vibrio parahaemolyticus UCM-V493]BCB47760.1 Zn-dependent protease [Vibrio alginolyticus]